MNEMREENEDENQEMEEGKKRIELESNGDVDVFDEERLNNKKK